MDASDVRERATDLPTDPGVYQFLDGDTVLYVGKAVDIRARVRSYADPRGERIRQMVERAGAIDFAVTDTETQALLLEANLVKRHQPRYNVRLKDDKSYPLVQLTDHPVPRIEVTRDPEEGATVFGPYTDKGRVETVVKALRETYGVRGCSDHKYANRDRPCLDYEMGLCTAPCTGEIAESDYREDVESIVRFFEGETGVLADPLRRTMEEAAQAENFERAANARDKLEAVESFHGAGEEAVTSQSDERAVDVLGVAIEGDAATVARLHSERGQLVDRSRHRLDAPEGGERSAAVLSAFLTQYYAERELPDAILLSERPDDDDVVEWLNVEGVSVRVPGAGREAKLIDLALKNARRGPTRDDGLAVLAERLDIPRPSRIEGFDVSHAQGKAVVGSDVCFVDGSAEKADYRRKKLPERNDDYENMRALIRWRAERAVEGRDDRPDPDLLLIDGGDGQLGAARDALTEVGWDVPAIALAKDEELVITPDGVYDWPSDAPHLHVLQRVRDEAHRFAVQYHQTLRDDVRTVLDDVPGVGEKTRRALLRRFGSVENVRAATTADLTDVPGVGEKTATELKQRLSGGE
ncbi:excinuclease ABC subunit C [Halogeometricum borinquense DSM 11551]|uniref:UvrABC system protein C n=2 Tax=Halogeometricum borinquense TaxID=60847 RepID=E4NSV7_HALBP|nr:excinuclease ABC subunit C [Halogeometricum borinquense]ADQ65845.1 Excinuclease ABC subunit C [Halogeometricum borinquense DSM 11551]ELY26847.1 excinuclease ABC subunit C [Halogeometricum borinquense DSM 11551]RYJ14885.1 excinuclease ABC subunit C [Halogeometricum borinquense]